MKICSVVPVLRMCVLLLFPGKPDPMTGMENNPFGGIIRVRFEGYNLSTLYGVAPLCLCCFKLLSNRLSIDCKSVSVEKYRELFAEFVE